MATPLIVVDVMPIARAVAGAIQNARTASRRTAAREEVKQPALQVKNARIFQPAFEALKSHEIYEGFEWPGFYEISNPGNQPVTITDFNVLWRSASFAEEQLSLVSRSSLKF